MKKPVSVDKLLSQSYPAPKKLSKLDTPPNPKAGTWKDRSAHIGKQTMTPVEPNLTERLTKMRSDPFGYFLESFQESVRNSKKK